MSDYDERVEQQIAQFADMGALWRSGSIMQYWMKAHIRPRIVQVFGAPGVFDVYEGQLRERIRHCSQAGRVARFLSIGSGDGGVEVGIARRLKSQVKEPFVIVATDLSELRLDRARRAAADGGVLDCFEFQALDLNDFRFDRKYDAFIAHHILHHIVNLEGLFETVHESMHQDSVFLSNDLIGRNGHKRWPETLRWIESLWPMLPSHYRFNYQFNRIHETYLDWDCSNKGFEGIRAQDILPLLVGRFGFEGFLGYGGIVDPFVDRGYGRNLDEARAEDRAFIDFVENLNQTLLETGRIKPTTMMAVMRRTGGQGRSYAGLTPEQAVRPVS